MIPRCVFQAWRNLPRRCTSKPGPAYRIPVGAGPDRKAHRKQIRLLIVATSSDRLFLDRVDRHQSPSPLHRYTQLNMHFSQSGQKVTFLLCQTGGHFYFALTGNSIGLPLFRAACILRGQFRDP